ncbi:Type II and III secretion system protein (modular protein) [Burkholderiales bacterium]|nr:Type II and III secretion system protein (modular protein) [Burkholderiales bacterium]
MKTKLQPYVAAISLLAQVAFGAPDDAAQRPSTQAATASSARPVALSMADPAPRAHGVQATALAQNSVTPGPTVSGPSVTLFHGEVQVLDLANVSRIAVGNGEVLRATVAEPGQVVLIGEGAGTTTLRVWTAGGAQYTYEVKVRPDDTARIVRDVQDLLASEPGLSVKQVDGHVLIEGDYSLASTAARIEAIQKIYPQVVSVAPVRKAPTAVAIERMVHMDVRVVEIRKSALERLGVNWSAQAAGPNLAVNLATSKNIPRPLNGGFFGIATNLTSMLDVLEQDGDSWTLAEPKVSCKSGGEAKFTVGGEIPVPVAAGLGTSTVIYKKYGIILEFKPVADDKGNVSSSIVAEVSEPDPTFSNVGNNGLVAFRQNRTETEVSLRENETLVISGLLRNSGSTAVNGIPGLKDVPVLGNLFRSKEFQNERTELVVMVTPRSIPAQAEANVASIKRADQITVGVNKIINSNMAE